MSGHLFFNDERWTGFDDGLYAAVRLLEILSRTDDPSGVLSKLPNAVNTPELQIPMAEGARVFSVEYLPGQFDQRADSCAQCVQLMAGVERPLVAYARVYLLEGTISDEELEEELKKIAEEYKLERLKKRLDTATAAEASHRG